jgi:hypothetical protein
MKQKLLFMFGVRSLGSACASVKTNDHQGVSPCQGSYLLEAESNCVTVKWDGEQLDANNQAVG